ncbi:MAG: DNA replication/repair protein RecF, partial [Acidimicrobiales bacterium]
MPASAPTPDASSNLCRLELRDVRLFVEAHLDLTAEATTVLTGANGSGKTTLLEAVAFLGSQRSFRTTAREALVRDGEERAVIRARLEREARPLLVESEVRANGSARTLVNHNPVQGRAALAEAVAVTVFSPDDLGLVQGPPARRREMMDAALRVTDARAAADLDAMDRILRQRAALLRQAGGRLGPEVAATLDVWDERLSTTGRAVSDARRALLVQVAPAVSASYEALAGPGAAGAAVTMTYVPGWEGDLSDALATSRREDVRRAASTVGPHRDEVVLAIERRDARVRASQGEQR